jgi:hypothetical protein
LKDPLQKNPRQWNQVKLRESLAAAAAVEGAADLARERQVRRPLQRSPPSCLQPNRAPRNHPPKKQRSR